MALIIKKTYVLISDAWCASDLAQQISAALLTLHSVDFRGARTDAYQNVYCNLWWSMYRAANGNCSSDRDKNYRRTPI
jgi:hypothetical protein